jgi:predicted CXXCH cytochrome family protein
MAVSYKVSKEVREMKKKILTLTIMIACIAMVALFCGPAQAVVTGRCDNCHTMHNSQDGGSMNFDGTTTAPTQTLLRSNCVGCHSSDTAGTYMDGTTGAPIVYHAGGATFPLAAGNFQYCDDAAVESAEGHNVSMINATVADSNIGAVPPPGFAQVVKPTDFTEVAADWGPATWASVAAEQVTCAGVYGCHGNRATAKTDSYMGIKGAHHTDDTSIDGTTIGTSYRFLAGIKGVECNTAGNEWEKAATSVSHNGYQGATIDTTTSTISHLCSQCHSTYHTAAGIGTGSPWLRHPTDVALTASADGIFTTDYTAYNVETPVAEASPSITESLVGTGSIVMCLSCHRAHASPNSDLLRFAYSGMDAGGAGTAGCLRCHKRQR